MKKKLFSTPLNKFRRGNEAAFKELYDQYYDPLYFFGLKFIPNQDVVEDIIQDAFVKVWERRNSFFYTAAFKAFLYKTVRNGCLNYIEHQKVVGNNMQFVKEEYWGEDFFLHAVIEEEMNRIISETLDQLPESSRLIYLLSLNGLKNSEIAEDLDISINTVKTQKQRATKFLRNKLRNLYSIMYFLV